MTNTSKALIWAAMMIAAALIMQGLDMSGAASMGVIGGLTGAAWGSLNSNMGCGRSCLQ